MAGPSTLTLTAATNSLTGTTQVNGGSLVGTVANIPTPVSLANNANVTYNQQTNATLSQVVGGIGSLTKAGTAALILNGNNTYTGATMISAGTLQVGDGASGSIGGTSSVSDSGILAFDLSSGTTSFTVNVSGSGGLTQMGTNVLRLTGTNNYTGATTISAGTLQVGGDAAGSSSTVSIGSGEVLDLAGYTSTIGFLTGGGTVTSSSSNAMSTLTLADGLRHGHLQRRDPRRRQPDRPDAQPFGHRGPRRRQHLQRPDHDRRRHPADRRWRPAARSAAPAA